MVSHPRQEYTNFFGGPDLATFDPWDRSEYLLSQPNISVEDRRDMGSRRDLIGRSLGLVTQLNVRELMIVVDILHKPYDSEKIPEELIAMPVEFKYMLQKFEDELEKIKDVEQKFQDELAASRGS